MTTLSRKIVEETENVDFFYSYINSRSVEVVGAGFRLGDGKRQYALCFH